MRAGQSIYLDYAASAPLAPGVAQAMSRALEHANANPASAHAPGRAAAAEIAAAARRLGAPINAAPDALVWTSGATESINLALKGVAEYAGPGAQIVSAATEHSATLGTLAWLERRGVAVTRLGVDSGGRIDLAELAGVLAGGATLVSVMHVNNETGVIQDIAAIGALCAEHGAALHVDAAQSLGRLAVDVQAMNIALLSVSAHKIGGPKGIGALYVRPRPRAGLAAQLHGGGQQGRLRSGTLAPHQIAGFGVAASHAAAVRGAEQRRQAALRERLWQRLAAIDGVSRNGAPEHTAAAFLNVSVDRVHGAALLTGLTEGAPALAVSAGSACSAASAQSSHVLRAMGRGARAAAASVRFCVGPGTNTDAIDAAGQRVAAEIERLRALAPAA